MSRKNVIPDVFSVNLHYIDADRGWNVVVYEIGAVGLFRQDLTDHPVVEFAPDIPESVTADGWDHDNWYDTDTELIPTWLKDQVHQATHHLRPIELASAEQ